MIARRTMTPRMPQNSTKWWYCLRDREVAQDHGDHEHVVHGQALLDQEPGEIGHARPRRRGCARPRSRRRGPRRCSAALSSRLSRDPDLARVAVQHAEVEGEQEHDDPDEAEPHPARPAEQLAVQDRVEPAAASMASDGGHRLARRGRGGCVDQSVRRATASKPELPEQLRDASAASADESMLLEVSDLVHGTVMGLVDTFASGRQPELPHAGCRRVHLACPAQPLDAGRLLRGQPAGGRA